VKSSDLTGKAYLFLTKSKLLENWRTNGAQPLRAVFEEAGYQTELGLCDSPDDMCAQIKSTCKAGDIVAIGGGDGTINTVLDTIIATKSVLIPIPMGTANDFARTLGLPDDLIDAARASVHGQIRMLDVGTVNDRSFINAASIGVPADARKRINPGLKRALGAISYAVANWQSWHEMAPLALDISCGSEPAEKMKLRQLTITNGRYFGGGLRPSENKSPEDGLLHIFAIRDSVDTLSGLDIAAELLFGSVDNSGYALTMECDEIRIEGEDGAPILADGEIIGELPARFGIRPAVLPVFAPNSYVSEDNHHHPDHPEAIPQQNELNDILRDTLDFALRLKALFPVVHNSTLKSLCHDSSRTLRDIYRQLELSLRPFGMTAASPDPDLHSLEELRDRVMDWLFDNADIRLANGLEGRASQLAVQLKAIETDKLPDDIARSITTLDQQIGQFRQSTKALYTTA
jgi:YegS/Rv2252/BmrU family lipid kinase